MRRYCFCHRPCFHHWSWPSELSGEPSWSSSPCPGTGPDWGSPAAVLSWLWLLNLLNPAGPTGQRPHGANTQTAVAPSPPGSPRLRRWAARCRGPPEGRRPVTGPEWSVHRVSVSLGVNCDADCGWDAWLQPTLKRKAWRSPKRLPFFLKTVCFGRGQSAPAATQRNTELLPSDCLFCLDHISLSITWPTRWEGVWVTHTDQP